MSSNDQRKGKGSKKNCRGDKSESKNITPLNMRRDTPDRERRETISIALVPWLLERATQAAKRCGISRAAWISYAISCQLDREEPHKGDAPP